MQPISRQLPIRQQAGRHTKSQNVIEKAGSKRQKKVQNT
jgi:hypothetical protein